MRSSVLVAFTLSACVAVLAAPASAQLQWQSSGVRTVAHEQAPPVPQRPAAKKPAASRAKAPVAKRPTRVATPPPHQPRAMARQASATPPAPEAIAPPAPLMAPQQQPAYDPSVSPACHDCQEHTMPMGGETYYEEGPVCGIDGCGDCCGCGDACGCGDPCGCGDVCGSGPCTCGLFCYGGCRDRGAVPLVLMVPPIQELTLHAGVQAFKNPYDLGHDRGNFGTHAGINAGGRMAWLPFPQLGYQIGYRGVHSQLHGDTETGSSSARKQQFLTAGLFHRKPVGLQYGVVYDLLSDDRSGNYNFDQIRGLISISNPCGHEVGFMFASHGNEERIDDATYYAADQYLLFYRRQGPQGGEGRVFAGFDDDSKGILGADISVPLNQRWSFESGFTCFIPEEDGNAAGADQEVWNLGMRMVWHFGKRAKRCYHGQFRPMFDVADNGSFVLESQHGG